MDNLQQIPQRAPEINSILQRDCNITAVIYAWRLLRLLETFWNVRGRRRRIEILPRTTRDVREEAVSLTNCLKFTCMILVLDVTMQAALLGAALSANENRSKCEIWWIPSTLSGLFSSVTLFALVYLLKSVYSMG